MSVKGRPEREYRSAQREGTPMSATGRPEREYRSAQREGTPMSTAGPPLGANCAPFGGSAAAAAASVGAR